MRFTILLLALSLLTGCGKSVFSNQKKTLFSVDQYYKYMQWKYYEKATDFVYPEDVTVFDRAISGVKDDLNITGYEIKELVVLDEKDKEQPTTVRVVITYYKYPFISEKRVEIIDTWVKRGKVWLIKSDFDSEIFKD